MTSQIFIIEDHQAMQNAYRLLIEQEADMAICGIVESAEEALEQLPDVEPNLVVVDLSLPGMSGLELLEYLTRERPELPTVVISGHVERHYVESALRAGTQGYIDKKDVAIDIPKGFREVLQGNRYFSERIHSRIEEWGL